MFAEMPLDNLDGRQNRGLRRHPWLSPAAVAAERNDLMFRRG
jgi:hypothetical protein